MPADRFLKIDGIDGESSDAKHRNELEVLSFSWGVTQAITGTVSSSGTFTGQRCDMSPLVVEKLLDKASAKVAQACAAGDHFASAVLTLCRAGGDKQPYMEYKLYDVLLSSYTISGQTADGGLSTERISLNYGKIEMTYTQIGTDGKAKGKAGSVGWDLRESKKV
jgi:type VI secretion system secreted protein Hcp